MSDDNEIPVGELSMRTVAMPADTNPSGDIFGGWVLSQMDIAGGVVAHQRAKGRAATVAVDSMVFHQPGTYRVTLVVWDTAGRGGRAEKLLKVAN